MTRVVVAALPRELKALVRRWQVRPSGRDGVSVWVRDGVVAACAGIGGERAGLALEAALTTSGEGVEEVISFGLAGACAEGVRPGDAFWCGTVVEARSGERFGVGAPVLVSAGKIAAVAEKRRLRESYGASLVDMEAATVARVAAARGLRFRALKGVSDGVGAEMDGLERFATETGGFREGAFALHVALRPKLWRHALELGRASGLALRNATAMLEQVFREDATFAD